MSTVIIAIIVFGLVGLDVWYIVHSLAKRNGKLGCDGYCGSGCAGHGSSCTGGNCAECSAGCGNGDCHK